MQSADPYEREAVGPNRGAPLPQRPVTARTGTETVPGLSGEDAWGETQDTRVSARRSSELSAAQGRDLTPELTD